MKKYLFASSVLLIFLLIFGLLAFGLTQDPRDLPSVILNKPIPQFKLTTLDKENYSNDDLPKDRVFLLNVWGSWCPACHEEHPFLLKIKLPIIGINWPADNPNEEKDAINFLQKLGNPYQQIIVDKEGKLITDLGVYGAPETFLIIDNKIVYRYAGILDKKVFDTKFQPIINSL